MGLKKTLQKMKDYKIEKKLTVSFRFVLAMLLLSVVVCISGLIFVSSSFGDFYKYYHTITVASLDARMSVQGAVKSVAITLLTDDEAAIERFQKDAVTYIDRLGADLEVLNEKYRGDISSITETTEALKAAKEYREKINGYVNEGKHAEALNVYMNEYGPTMTIVQTNMTELDEMVSGLADGAYKRSSFVDKMVIVVAVVISIFSFLSTLSLAKALVKMLKEPVEEIEKAAVEMSKGSLHVQLNYTSEDEFGSLADSMRTLCMNINTIIADISRIQDELSKGNFQITSNCLERYEGDYEPILLAMRAVRDKLNATLLEINESANVVAEGSVQLSEGAKVLAEGSMDQAGAVEELTATVEDVSTMAENSADEAENAYQKVAAAEKEADQSQHNLLELTDAMQGISDTSLKIQAIITTIEDIASQTNLLSLNASIEAARAGEAGRGFAVVADQIGKLAADSAQSAVDTKELIGKCIDEIQQGNNIMERTVKGIENVLESIRLFEEVAKSSSSTSRQQADMLEQIQKGIEQISTNIQTNSAAAEETAATSQELSKQADCLKGEVNKFKLV